MKVLSYIFLVLAVVLCLSLFWFYNWGFQISTDKPLTQDVYACDFKLKMNEIECVLKGVNPFDVWSQKVQLPDFYPNSRLELWSAKRCKCVNSHPPWEYAVLMPFKLFPLRKSWMLYAFLQALSWLGIGIFAYKAGASLRGRHVDGVFVAACALMVPRGALHDFRAGNLCLYITFASVGMAYALNKKHDVIAGLLWPIAMLKPQMGVLFAVPILLAKKFSPCLIAGVICIGLSIPAAVLCDCSLIDMILQPPQSSTFAFWGCGLLPHDVLEWLVRQGFERALLLSVVTTVGFVLCVLMTMVINDEENWFVRFLPAVVCSLTCTYAHGYNFCLCSVIQVALAVCIVKYWHRKTAVVLICICAFFSLRFYDLFYYVVEQAYGILTRNHIWRWEHIPEELNLTFTSLSSTGLLVFGILVCMVIAKYNKQEVNRG